MKTKASTIGCLFLVGLGTWLTIIDLPEIMRWYNEHTPILETGPALSLVILLFGILWGIKIARQKPKV